MTTEPTTILNLDEQLVQAQANEEAAMVTLQNRKLSPKEIIAAADAAKFAVRAVEKLNTAITKRDFEKNNEIRLGVSQRISQVFGQVPVDATAYGLGIRSIRVDIQEDGSTTVSVGTLSQSAPRTSTAGTGVSRGRSAWLYNGGSYTSAELLEQFGGEAGAAAIFKARNPEAGKASAGFDGAVKKLAKELGATRAEA